MSSTLTRADAAADPVFQRLRALLTDVLQLGERGAHLTPETELLGALPEFDSMAVASVVAGIEDSFDLIVEDDDLDAETFRSVGTLWRFVADRLAEA